MSSFINVEPVPPGPAVEIFALNKAYNDDQSTKKINLSIGAYRDDDGKPWVLPVVRKMESDLATSTDHEYLEILGDSVFSSAATSFLLGYDSEAIKQQRTYAIQTLSGTGGLRVGADFLSKFVSTTVYISAPTWPNHNLVFKNAGFSAIKSYRYWDAQNRALDFDGLMADLSSAPAKSVILLHACAHNPTGIDPTREQWQAIAKLIQEKNLFTFFDCAYQGFASGDLSKDAWPVRYFVSQGIELICAQSFAKNFGLYNERVGNLTFVVNDLKVIPNIKSQLTLIVRGNYSNPPAHGMRVVKGVLTDMQLFSDWQDQVKTMANRIIQMRQLLRDKVENLGTPGKWNHITDQIGMFSFTGLTEPQIKYMVEQCHVYLPKNGRISLCGINSKNIDHLAQAINEAVTKFP